MTSSVSPIILLDAIRKEKQKRAAEISLYEFMRQGWHIIEPGTPFVEGWHIQAICEHLEAVTDGDIRQLLINMPPRHAKSIIVAVMWPAWVWVTRPEHRWLFASYAETLSVRDSLKCRRLVSSIWYQSLWGDVFLLTGDQNAKTFFENDKFGYRFATSVGASTTGHGGDVLVVDDAHNAMDAQSEARRESTLEWWDQAMSTRLNDPKNGAKVIVMQRLHERDLSGHVLKKGGWEHLCLPAEYDGRRIRTCIGWEDPRSVEGSLLWPEQFDRKALDTLKLALGEYGTAGQLQQLPAPASGGILRTKHLQMWPNDNGIPALLYVLQSYDTAFTERTSGDPSACSTWGVFQHEGRNCVLLLDSWADHLPYADLRDKLMDDWKATYGSDSKRNMRGRRADAVLIEQKGSGLSLIQDLNAANIPAIPYNPGKADKVARAHQAAPILEMDCIYVLESKKNPGQFIGWAQPLIEQMQRFPAAEHDDLVDTFTQAMIFLRDQGLLELPFVEEEEVFQRQPKRQNPYGV